MYFHGHSVSIRSDEYDIFTLVNYRLFSNKKRCYVDHCWRDDSLSFGEG